MTRSGGIQFRGDSRDLLPADAWLSFLPPKPCRSAANPQGRAVSVHTAWVQRRKWQRRGQECWDPLPQSPAGTKVKATMFVNAHRPCDSPHRSFHTTRPPALPESLQLQAMRVSLTFMKISCHKPAEPEGQWWLSCPNHLDKETELRKVK